MVERTSRLDAVQVMVPLVPTAGVAQVKTPAGSEIVAETNVALAEMLSVTCT